MKNEPGATIAVIGGSGLYRLFDSAVADERSVRTPYGAAEVTLGTIGGRTVAFLARHGAGHTLAPHQINFRANIWALASLGVRAIVSSSAVGGISPDYAPGTLVLTDQFIDRTTSRADTFFDLGSVEHLPSAEPFCPELLLVARTVLGAREESFQPSGTVVVIQGPRFSTRAESLWYRAAGAHTVNMTLYPEVPLASELGMGTVNLSFVTDSDAVEATDGVSGGLVFERLAAAQPRIVAALETIVSEIPDSYRPRQLIPRAEIDAVLRRPVI